MTHVNIRNIEFRDFAAAAKYPFTDDSTYTAVNGRGLPLSLFIDIILYPFIEKAAPIRISRIYAAPSLTIEFRSTVLIGTCALTDALEGGTIYSPDKRIIGTITTTMSGVAYLRGLAKHSALLFNDTGLVIRPERVLPRPDKKIQVTVGGVPVIRMDKELTAEFKSGRFTVSEEGDMDFDNSIRADKANRVITHLHIPSEDQLIEIDNRPVIIHSVPDANLQIIIKDGALMFHARGDN